MNPPQPPFFDVRMRGFRDRTEVADALALLNARIVPLPAKEVPLPRLAGRILTEPIVASVDVPAFARAAMDGFAVRGSDTFAANLDNPLLLSLIGESRPAKPFVGTVGPGQAVRIMTGAPMPAGTDAVLVAEVAQIEPDGTVLAPEAVAPGRHVGRVGEDVAKGREVLAAGRRLRPQDVGLLASIGLSGAKVVRRPRVAILVTGNELLPPGSQPEGFKIVDSNSPMLAALVARDGGEPAAVQSLPDDYAAVRDAIREASSTADVILISGGSSVGAEDHAPRALVEIGELAVHGVALRPASPTGIGFVAGRVVFLLPGNPVSCLCAYDLFAGRVIRRLGGLGWELPYRRESIRLTAKIVSAIGRVDYVRVKVEEGHAAPIAASGASILSSTVMADGFVLVDRDRERFAPGDVVEVWMYER